MERIEGFVKGIPNVISKDEVIPYLQQIITRNGSKLSALEIEKGNFIQVTNFIFKKDTTCAYGYKCMTISDLNNGNTPSLEHHDEAVSIASHLKYNSSDHIPYIKNYIEPKDGKIIFKSDGVFTYFERKVYNLVGSWEDGTLEAINHKQLFLVVDGIRRYPDNNGVNRAPKGFYLQFTVAADDVPIKQDEPVNISVESPTLVNTRY